MSDPSRMTLTLRCPDQSGIVHAVTGVLANTRANIVSSQQFGDGDTGDFFMRVEFDAPPACGIDKMRRYIEPAAETYGMEWQLRGTHDPVRTLVMVSKFDHCLADLLYESRQHATLNTDIVAVVSNHPDLAPLAERYGVPYHHVPVTQETKADAEAELLSLVDRYDAELVVLARYMQILSDELCRRMEGRVINIHHSFLPSFKGAKPYHQAHARGVKLIGATAHYVTPDLDEGPIIEQGVGRVDHAHGADRLVEVGRDIESSVLARAVRWHCDQRVLLNGDRTVVFP